MTHQAPAMETPLQFRQAWKALWTPETKASATWPILLHMGGTMPQAMDQRFEAYSKDGYRKNVVVYRCVSMLAQSAASVPWGVYRGDELVEEGDFATLIGRPNPWQGLAEFIEAYVAFYLIAGDSFVEAVGPDSGPPLELYTLRPDRMRVHLNKLVGSPDAYSWTVGGGKQRWEMDPVSGDGPILHWKSFDPLDRMWGLSSIRPSADAIDQHNAAGQRNFALLNNMATPSGALIQKEGELTPEQYARLKLMIEQQFTGTRNSGRPMLLEQGLDWKQMGLSPKDMDWIKGKDISAREIGLAFGVPPQLLGIPDTATFANFREARLAFWVDTVIPLIVRSLGAMNAWTQQWWPDLRLDYVLDDVPALSLERERKAKTVADLVKGSVLTPNEARQELGKPPLPGGDQLLAPASFLPLDVDGTSTIDEDEEGDEGDEGTGTADDDDDDPDKVLALPRGGTSRRRAERLARLAYGRPALVPGSAD